MCSWLASVLDEWVERVGVRKSFLVRVGKVEFIDCENYGGETMGR